MAVKGLMYPNPSEYVNIVMIRHIETWSVREQVLKFSKLLKNPSK